MTANETSASISESESAPKGAETKAPNRSPRNNDRRNKVAALTAKGNTEREIAAITGLSKTTIHNELQALKADPDFLAFRDTKADVLEALQYKITNAIDHADIKIMLSKRGMTDVAILEDKIRLIRGQQGDVNYNQVQAIAINLNLGDLLRQRDVIDVTPDT